MITPTSGTLIASPAVEQKIADGIWISNVYIDSPSPLKPISATIRVVPFNSSNGEVFMNKMKQININDVQSEASSYPILGQAMNTIIEAVEALVSGKNTF
jgi:hypothetical protein